MISVSIITNPDDLSPIINSPVWFRLDSASSSLSNFKYVVRLNKEPEPFSGVFDDLQIYKLPPRPYGECEYTPHKMLESFFGYKPQPFIYNWSGVDDALIRYNINYGFEYNPNISFTGTFNNSGFLGLSFSSQPDITTGDVIRINKDNKQINIGYDGLSTVTSTASNAIVTNLSFGTTYSDETGSITSLLRLNATSSNYECFYGARQYDEVNTDFTDNYVIGYTQSTNFLTENTQTYKPVLSSDYETLSCILSATQGYTMYIEKYNSSNNILGTHSQTISATSSYKRVDYGVGPMNIIADSASASFFNNVDYYKTWIEYDTSIYLNYSTSTYSYSIKLAPFGTYNSKYYYNWNDGYNDFYFWYSTGNVEWEVSNALGGGNDYLFSTTGDTTLPLEGSRAGGGYTDGSNPLFTIFIVEDVGLAVSEEKKFKINDYCLSDENVRLCFLNRVGGYDYFNFRLGGKKSINVERNTYKKLKAYNYTIGDRGETTYSQKAEELWSIQSDWITEEESEWLTQLIESREVYHIIGTNIYPIQIVDKSYQVKSTLRDQLFNLQLQFKYAFNKVI